MTSDFEFDAFISYSRNDKVFATELLRTLLGFRIPKSVRDGRRRLKVFLDTEDLTGTEYYEAITRHLRASRKLIVICSPSARSSNFVSDEIVRYLASRPVDSLIPVLVDGIPNNEAGDHANFSFPEVLTAAMTMPRAIDCRAYRSGSLKHKRHNESRYGVLAEVLDTSRELIEERDRKQKHARLCLYGGLATTVIATTLFFANDAWQAKREFDAAYILQRANEIVDVRARAVELTKLDGLPVPAGALEALLSSHDALYEPVVKWQITDIADNTWARREQQPTVFKRQSAPAMVTAMMPECTPLPLPGSFSGLTAPDNSVGVYLNKNQLFVEYAGEPDLAYVFCLDLGTMTDSSSGMVSWREGAEELKDRVGFMTNNEELQVLVKDTATYSLHVVTLIKPTDTYKIFYGVESAYFTETSGLIIKHKNRPSHEMILMPAGSILPGEITHQCYDYDGPEKSLSELLDAAGFDRRNKISNRNQTEFSDTKHTKFRSCYLNNGLVFAFVADDVNNPGSRVTALRRSDNQLLFTAWTLTPECTAFGNNVLSFCQSGDASREQISEKVGFYSFDEQNSIVSSEIKHQNFPVQSNHWPYTAYGKSLASVDKTKILIWTNPIMYPEEEHHVAFVWLEHRRNRGPILIDRGFIPISQVEFSPDSERLLILWEDGRLKVWSFDPEELIESLLDRVN